MTAQIPLSSRSRTGILTGVMIGMLPVAAAHADATRLTIYQNGLGMVQQTRQLHPDAAGWAALPDLSRQTVVDSLRVAPTQGSVLQQAFRDDPPTLDALLERHVGQRVTLIHTNPANGAEQQRDPTLIAFDGARALIDDGDGVESIPIAADTLWRFRFPALPAGMTARPGLRVQLDRTDAQPAELSYLTGGLDWQARYQLVLADDGGNRARGDLAAHVLIDNQTGIDWREARVELVAGEVNRVSAPERFKAAMPQMRVMAMDSAAGSMPDREAVGDFHLYRFPFPVDLPAGEHRDLRLLALPGLDVARTYRFEFNANPGYYQRLADADDVTQAAIRLRLEHHGTEPLPSGLWRVYLRGADGTLRLLGEDQAGHTPVGRDVELGIGRAFDLTARRTQTDFERLNNRETQSDWRVALANAGATDVTVDVIEQLGINAEVRRASADFERLDAQRVRWRVELPAGGERELSYRIHTRQP